MIPVPAQSSFADAIAKGSLNWACADAADDLEALYKHKGLPFHRDMIQSREEGQCHIYYEKTLAGFRASPEDSPVSGLAANINTLAFLARRADQVGDSLDVLKTVLGNVRQPLPVLIDVSAPYHERHFTEALRFHFGNLPHAFRFHHDESGDVNPWIQDILKYGSVGSSQKVLVTRQAFEGNGRVGKILRPMLDSYKEPLFVRSKLSFEGGDLLFATRREDRSKLVMFYGTAAKGYWAESLSRREFEYVLLLEFGADEAMYFGDVTPHVDYSLSLLPDGQTALVVEPVCSDNSVAAAALDLLLSTYSSPPHPELTRLTRLVTRGLAVEDKAQIMEETEAAAAAMGTAFWKSNADVAGRQEIAHYVKEHCPLDPKECVSPKRMPALIEQHLQFIQRWIQLGDSVRMKQTLATRLFEIIRRQASGCDESVRTKLDENAESLSRMGYRVIRVPWLQGDGSPRSPWPGISYANVTTVNRTLFVPRFGLGSIETNWFAELKRQLPASYDVVPTPATALLLDNGGIHCAVALGRTVARK